MTPIPTRIQLHKQTKILELQFGPQVFQLSAEYLRVHSPSAEVKGHGPNQKVLQHGKQEVAITGIERAGNYALKLIFDDGHDSGIYTWDYLYSLGIYHEQNWKTYLDNLSAAKKSREPGTTLVKFV